MRAGLLTDVIKVYSLYKTKNTYGEEVETYQLHITTRARVIHNSGNRQQSNDEIFFAYSKTFDVRRYLNIKETDRILWNGKYYRILSIEDDRPQNKKVIQTELIND